ncbi:MAG: chromate efflux transporter [Candidatus Methylomirabilia bacterium]
MARTLCPDQQRATIAILATIGILMWPTAAAQVLVIIAAGVIGWRFIPAPSVLSVPRVPVPFGRRLGVTALGVFFALLVVVPLLRYVVPSQPLAVFDSFYRAGSLVFGGGHVVLPLLQAEVVPPGWVSKEQFVAGYGAAQAVPGPLFTFAAYLGAVMLPWPNGWVGAALALGAIFLPSFMLVIGVLPFWDALRVRPVFQAALRGVNAAVVGLLLAALYQPVWTSAIRGPADVALALAAFALLMFWATPPWLVVVLTAAAAGTLAALT